MISTILPILVFVATAAVIPTSWDESDGGAKWRVNNAFSLMDVYTTSVDDTDGDGLSNNDERTIYNTNPDAADTDGDGISDGDEVNTTHSNPRQRDSDFDTLSDFDEVRTYRTNPLAADTDGDGRTDGQEVLVDGTDPSKSANDGVTGGVEATQRRTDTNAHPSGVNAEIRRLPVYTCDADSLEIFFHGGASRSDLAVGSANADRLNQLADCMLRCPAMRLMIEGNASSDGRPRENQRLSDSRAREVYRYLVEVRKISSSRVIRRYGISARSPKASEQLARNARELRAARSENRRVVIMVLNPCK